MMADATRGELIFRVDVSVRYHDRRRAFFDLMHKLVAAVSVLGGSAAVFGVVSLLKEWQFGELTILVGALAVSMLNTLDLVIGFSPKAREHDSLYRRYIELDAEMVKDLNPSPETVRAWESKVLMIERDDPPVYWGIYAQCWNQSVHSLGRKKHGLLDTDKFRLWFGLGHFFRYREQMFPPARGTA